MKSAENKLHETNSKDVQMHARSEAFSEGNGELKPTVRADSFTTNNDNV